MAYELFKGYIETKGKQAIEKFKNRTDFKNYKQVKELNEFAGVLNDETILIDVDDFEQSEILMGMVVEMGLKCRVYATTRGKHFIFKNTTVQTCKTHTKTVCGLEVDIKIGAKSTYEVLKFDGKERKILYDILDSEDYEPLPKWLLPIKTTIDLVNMAKGDGRNQKLFNYILVLQSEGFTTEEIKEYITMINKYVFAEPLTEEELKVILRDEAFAKPSFLREINSYLISLHDT